MARTVSVGKLQQMHREASEMEVAGDFEGGSTHDLAQRDPLSGGLVSANGKGPGFQAPSVPVADQLRALVLQDDISGMPLGQVVGLVRIAVITAHVNATEREIRDEAERRRNERAEADAHLGTGYGLEEPPIEPTAEDREPDFIDALAEAMADGRVGEISVAPSDGINEPTIADHLAGLGVERQCTAEMSLHMITTRVREAAMALPAQYAPTENDIVLEAERILSTFSDNRKGPRVADVNPDGTVSDWRRPDTTPDRGPDVGTTVHTVGDDEPRFSGAGASDGPEPSKLVPTDQQFGGKLYRDGPELANIAERLIGEHGFLADLINCEIRYFWRRKTGVSKGRVKIGYCKRASDLLGHFTGCDFLIWLSATTARDGKFTDRQIEAAVFHQLCHIETDDEGNFISARHDFEGFASEVRVYGTWTEDLKLGGQAFTAAHQMGLFDVDDGIEDDDDEDEREEAARAGYVETPDGAGVLIHADGTPLSADEIAEQEAAETEGETRVECSLCTRVIPDEDVEDTFCPGCSGHICGLHRGDTAFGSHAQEAHLSSEDDDEEDILLDDPI